MIIDAAKEKQEEGCDDDGCPIKACEDVIMDASCNIQENINIKKCFEDLIKVQI